MTSDRIEQTRERLRGQAMDAICGYGEAMFIRGNPYNKPDQRLDQKAVWNALDALVAFERAEARHKDIRDTLDGNEWKQTKAALERICAEVLG